jgi:hypothetical protein
VTSRVFSQAEGQLRMWPLVHLLLSAPPVSVKLPQAVVVWLMLQLQLWTAGLLVTLRRAVMTRYREWEHPGEGPAYRNEAAPLRRSLDALALYSATWSVIKVLPQDITRDELARRASAMLALVSLGDTTRVYVAHRALWSRWTSCPPSYVRGCERRDLRVCVLCVRATTVLRCRAGAVPSAGVVAHRCGCTRAVLAHGVHRATRVGKGGGRAVCVRVGSGSVSDGCKPEERRGRGALARCIPRGAAAARL